MPQGKHAPETCVLALVHIAGEQAIGACLQRCLSHGPDACTPAPTPISRLPGNWLTPDNSPALPDCPCLFCLLVCSYPPSAHLS